MKDFYWDIRPKPEFGTIEVRVCDTPLDRRPCGRTRGVHAGDLRMLLDHPVRPEREDIYLTYNYNRFQACRFGLEGQVIDSATGAAAPLHEDGADDSGNVPPVRA